MTNAGELGYQAAFAQLIAAEGYRVLHTPTHHPFEHGKDLVATAPNGDLCAFQLKGGEIDLAGLERIQGQLFALAGTAVAYPGIEPPRAPDRVALVTNNRLTPPARDRLRAFNEANRLRHFPIVEAIEAEQLVGRFVAAHGAYLPTAIGSFNELLELVLAKGTTQFPSIKFSGFLADLIREHSQPGRHLALGRVIASSTLLTAYVAGPWQRTDNHLGVAEAWLTLALRILHSADVSALEEQHWLLSFELARDSARRALDLLLEEAFSSEDLVIPDIIEGMVYATRAALVCGYCSAFLVSETQLGNLRDVKERVQALLLRELDRVKIPGEAGAPHLLMVANACELLGDQLSAVKVVTSWAHSLTVMNHPDNPNGTPNPYHSLNDALLADVGAESPVDDESFAGQAYSLHVAIEWLARRGYREVVERLWPAVTHIHFVEYQPGTPRGLLSHYDHDGRTHTWIPATPQSWAKLQDQARALREDEIPRRLWQHFYLLPYLPLLFPYRLTSTVGKALDYMTRAPCTVTLLKEHDAPAG